MLPPGGAPRPAASAGSSPCRCPAPTCRRVLAGGRGGVLRNGVAGSGLHRAAVVHVSPALNTVSPALCRCAGRRRRSRVRERVLDVIGVAGVRHRDREVDDGAGHRGGLDRVLVDQDVDRADRERVRIGVADVIRGIPVSPPGISPQISASLVTESGARRDDVRAGVEPDVARVERRVGRVGTRPDRRARALGVVRTTFERVLLPVLVALNA